MPRISELPAADALTGTEVLPLVQGGTTKQGVVGTMFTELLDPHLFAFDHSKITHSNRTALDLVTGSNTGDQDLSGLVTAAALAASSGASLVGFLQDGTGAVARTAQSKLRERGSIRDFGAVGGGADESAAAVAMIAAHNRLYVPPGFVLTMKNVEVFDNTEIICEGTLRLPDACSDFDRLIRGAGRSGVRIMCKDIDGNYAGQSGNIGTHLIYLVNCSNAVADIKMVRDHYIARGAAMTSVDGFRNTSSGAIFLYQCNKSVVTVGLIDGWGREAIYLLNCTKSEVTLGHAQGKYVTEYSGVQVSGQNNSVNRASVDFAGASAVGFDTQYGFLSNVIATNTRENSGVNFGHTGYPATGSVAENIVVDGAFGIGISVLSASQDLSINNFSVQNTGDAGVQFSDSVVDGKLSNGSVAYPAQWNLVAGATAQIQTTNVKSSVRDAKTLLVDMVSGTFQTGETVTTATGSAVVRRALRNLTVSQQRLFFASVTGTFSGAQAITGGTSGASGTINAVYTPAEYNETSGGLFIGDPRYFPGTGNQTRFPDGTAIYTWNRACVYTTAGTSQNFVQTFSSNILWASAPYITATVSSFDSTAAFIINHLVCAASTTQATISIQSDVNQTYGVALVAVGRWK
jgi:hypothetical protein